MVTPRLVAHAMVSVQIEYCVPCGLLDPAVATQRELLRTFGRDLEEVSLKTGHGGVFMVRVEDELVFDKATHGDEIALDAIVDAVDTRVSSEA